MASDLPSPHGRQFDPDSFSDMRLTTMSSAIVPVVVIGPECCKYVKYEEFLARLDLHLETVWRAIEPALSPR